jgi:hypothetical protein
MLKARLRSREIFLILILAAIVPAGAQIPAMSSSQSRNPSAQTRFDQAIAGLKEAEQALNQYERIERIERRRSSNDPQPYDVKVWRVFPAGTGTARIALGRDEQPADAAAYRAELEKLVSSLTWAAAGGKAQREAYEKVAKKQKERLELIDATRFAFVFTPVSQESRYDRMLTKFRMEPNPSYRATNRGTAIFAKVKGFVWIDDASGQMARVQGEVTDDISFGLFLGKIYKGSHFMQERYEFAPGVWLPSFSQYDFDARKLFSSMSIHDQTFASKYRRVGTPAEAIPTVRAELEQLSTAVPAGNNP